VLDCGQLFIEQVKNSSRTPLLSVLLYGPSGSGKTALAATLALKSEFPFIKLISPDQMLGYSEAAKCSHITKVFNDAYRSPLSVIVIDDIERILDYVAIGPRFSNTVLQTLLVLLKKAPSKGRKLLILATTSQKFVLHDMEFDDAFSAELLVPPIESLDAVQIVLTEMQAFSDVEIEAIVKEYQNYGIDLTMKTTTTTTTTISPKLSIGIKKLLMIIERARQEQPEDRVQSFISYLKQEGIFLSALK
jgi:vesicle-fusing ATPase